MRINNREGDTHILDENLYKKNFDGRGKGLIPFLGFNFTLNIGVDFFLIFF